MSEHQVRTLDDANDEYYWELFLRAYLAEDPDAKAEFDAHVTLNRHERRALECRARKLRNRAA